MNKPHRPRLSVARIEPWNHDQHLKSLKGKRVVLNFVNGSGGTGTLTDFDRFTVLIERDDFSLPYTVGAQLIYKHAILSMHEVRD